MTSFFKTWHLKFLLEERELSLIKRLHFFNFCVINDFLERSVLSYPDRVSTFFVLQLNFTIAYGLRSLELPSYALSCPLLITSAHRGGITLLWRQPTERGIPRLTISANLPVNWNPGITSSSFLLLALKITATEPKTEKWNVRYADSPSTCADNPNWTLTFSKPTSSTKSLQPSTNHAYESSPYTMPTRSNEMPTLKPWKRSKKPSDTEWSSKSAWSIRHL